MHAQQLTESKTRPTIHVQHYQTCPDCEGIGMVCRDYRPILGHTADGTVVRGFYATSTACERCDTCEGAGRVRR